MTSREGGREKQGETIVYCVEAALHNGWNVDLVSYTFDSAFVSVFFSRMMKITWERCRVEALKTKKKEEKLVFTMQVE